VTVYHPPESDLPRPFVYGAMAHPELAGPEPGELVITYATNAWAFADLFSEYGSQHLYWPRVITVNMATLPPAFPNHGPDSSKLAGSEKTD
jgi:hypothetical protein